MARQTSIETYHQIVAEGLLSMRRLQVYQVVFESGPLTGTQIAQKVKAQHGSWSHSETIRNRLTELRDLGCVRELGEIKCPVTGRAAILWDVTAELPRTNKREFKQTKKQRIEELEQEVENLKLRLGGCKCKPPQMAFEEILQ